MTSATEQYLAGCRNMLERVAAQQAEIAQAADWFAGAILADRVVHLFGAGHSRIMVEEMWPRYGSFPGFHPIVELSLTFHNSVAGANGQRQAMFLENTSGLAARILRNFELSPDDAALVVSSSGCNVVSIEMAQELRRSAVKVVALVSRDHSRDSSSNHPQGVKLTDVADLVLDNGAPLGDAIVSLDDFETPVAPGSTVGGCMMINALKAEVATRLVERGRPPLVLTSGAVVGSERSQELFDAAYDEHGRLAAKTLRRRAVS